MRRIEEALSFAKISSAPKIRCTSASRTFEHKPRTERRNPSGARILRPMRRSFGRGNSSAFHMSTGTGTTPGRHPCGFSSSFTSFRFVDRVDPNPGTSLAVHRFQAFHLAEIIRPERGHLTRLNRQSLPPEVRIAEVRTDEARPAEVRVDEVGLDVAMLCPPPTPQEHSPAFLRVAFRAAQNRALSLSITRTTDPRFRFLMLALLSRSSRN